jgi:hypothetical protein
VGSNPTLSASLAEGPAFSARTCWQFSPVAAGFFIWTPDFKSAEPAHSSPNGPFISGALDSADLVRFSKFVCFERLMNRCEVGFCSSIRTGNNIRTRIFHFEVRIPPLQPAIPTFDQALQETRQWAGNLDFCVFPFVSGLPVCKVEAEIGESLRSSPRIFSFLRDNGRRPVRSRLAPGPDGPKPTHHP